MATYVSSQQSRLNAWFALKCETHVWLYMSIHRKLMYEHEFYF